MKTRIMIAIACLLPALLGAHPAQAQAELPAQLKYIDVQLEIFVPLMQQYEQDYFKLNGQYYQALGTHDTVPTGADSASDLTKRPTDQLTSLAPLWDKTGLPSAIAWKFTINTAVTPEGPGYSLVVYTVVKNVTWSCLYSYIPGQKSIPWEIVPEVKQ